MSDFKTKMHKNPISAGAPPQTSLVWKLTALPQTPLAGYKGAYFSGEGRGGKGGVIDSKKILKIDPVCMYAGGRVFNPVISGSATGCCITSLGAPATDLQLSFETSICR